MISALLIVAGCIAGGGADESAATSPPPIVVAETARVTVAAGQTVTVRIPVRIAEGHRVQANPASSDFLVPLEILLDDPEDVVLGAPHYPEGLPYRLEGTDDDLATYVGEVEITVPVTIDPDSPPGRRTVTGELRYQACNSRTCLFPASLTVNIQIDVN